MMRSLHIVVALALVLPGSAYSQGVSRAGMERFDTAGLAVSGAGAAEKEIFTLIRYHRRGDLKDAARIHLMLAEYYKQSGQAKRADDCSKMASEAWEAAENGVRVSAGTTGTPPFELKGMFRRNFAYTDDELGATHRWEFFDDGTYAHSLTTPAGASAPPPTEVGFYSVSDGQLRLWQTRPALDRTVSLTLLGESGQNGAVLDGIRMRAVR
jgi:hypothetical protein